MFYRKAYPLSWCSYTMDGDAKRYPLSELDHISAPLNSVGPDWSWSAISSRSTAADQPAPRSAAVARGLRRHSAPAIARALGAGSRPLRGAQSSAARHEMGANDSDNESVSATASAGRRFVVQRFLRTTNVRGMATRYPRAISRGRRVRPGRRHEPGHYLTDSDQLHALVARCDMHSANGAPSRGAVRGFCPLPKGTVRGRLEPRSDSVG